MQTETAIISSEGRLEADLIYGRESRFGIYQIPSGIEEARDFRFAPMRELEALGLTPERANYMLIYTAPLPAQDAQDCLNHIFSAFNNDERPADFAGRSVSVSDIIVLNLHGDVSSHYVDSMGFVELDSFLGEEWKGLPPIEALAQTKESDTYSHIGNKLEGHPKSAMVEEQSTGNRSSASRARPSLSERLAEARRRAAQQGQSDAKKNTNLEVGT